MLWKEHYQHLNSALQKIYSESEAGIIAGMLVEHAGNKNMRILADEIADDTAAAILEKNLQQLLLHRPVQYVLNEAWFYRLKFRVNESVLIPRPETEELVEWVLEDIGKSELQKQNQMTGSVDTGDMKLHSPFTILDIGTGSGCIPISIKKNLPVAELTAIDICSEALHVAMNNALEHKTDIHFQLLDFLDEAQWSTLAQYNLIISNPPYIKSSESNNLDKHVLQYEPHKALFVPDEDALLFYKKIAKFSIEHLKPGGSVYVEINQQFGKATADVFTEDGFKQVVLRKDVSGNDRFIKAGNG